MTDVGFPPGLSQAVAALDVRVRQVPSLSDSEDPTEGQARRRMLPALAVAYGARRPVVVCWARPTADRPVSVFVSAGTHLRGRARPDDRVEVAMPLGSVGTPLPGGQAARTLGALQVWGRCESRFDVLAAPERRRTSGPGLDDIFSVLAGRAMAWVIVGRPVARAAVADRLQDLSLAVGEQRSSQEGRGAERLAYERADAELRYLEQWSALGFWEMEVWLGGGSQGEVDGLGALLSASSDLAGVPVRLRLPPGTSRPAGDTEAPWSTSLVTTAEVVAALARPPVREIPGVRVVHPSTFDTTPEVHGPVNMGQVLDRSLVGCGPFGVSLNTLNRHTFVTGATGSGKSQTTRRLLEQLSRRDIPWLVIEPVKAEYASMAGRLAPLGKYVTVIRPGAENEPPASLNPLEPTSIVVDGQRKTFPLQTHLDFVRALFNAAFEAQEPFPQILSAALSRSYEKLGWNLALGRPLDSAARELPRYPTLADLQTAALEVVAGLGYGAEVRDNVRGFVTVRINSLRLGTPGRFFEAGHPVDLERLLEQNVVFEIENIGDDNDKAFFIGTVLLRIVELLRLRKRTGDDSLRHVLVLEEAHRLLRKAEPGTPAAHAVEMFGDLLAEIRAYGEGIVVAEQIPSKIIQDVIKNSALKIIHRLPSADDRSFVGATMNLDEKQSAMVVALPPGWAAVHADGMDRPILVSVEGSGRALEADVAAAAPAPLSSRSRSCPDACSATLCTLASLERSAALARDPQFVLWVELGVVAHLAGEDAGKPATAWVTRIRQHGSSEVRCALGLAVDAAVHGRTAHLQPLYDPAALGRHVADVLFADLGRAPVSCPPEPAWRAGPFRWRDVTQSLNATAGLLGPHPSTEEWASQGLVLPKESVVRQFRALQDLLALQAPSYHSTIWGDHDALDASIAALTARPASASSLISATRFLTFATAWPADVLFWDGHQPSTSERDDEERQHEGHR